jgi:hypothetical protein
MTVSTLYDDSNFLIKTLAPQIDRSYGGDEGDEVVPAISW